ncbi:MAG: preprotein translocase subunit SecY [Raineya sp.]|jgi:preprotein translocase subunit SecY|nr:preprotein translocase subunit SecY [Raineya sp.]
MKKLIQNIKNIFAIEELRRRILNTLILLLVFRIGAHIVLPGINPEKLTTKANASKGLLGLLDTFLGGAFQNVAVFALGIMPYISASIAVQLLTVALPNFQKMQKEGDSGRKKLTQITKYLTIIFTIVQSYAYLQNPDILGAVRPEVGITYFVISSILILTAGTMFCMWLGDRITDRGIGNGVSMLIMVGIVSRFPQAIMLEVMARFGKKATVGGPFLLLIEFVLLFFIVLLVVMFTQAIRRIPVQYAKQVVGNKVYGGQRQYIPLKLNTSGVMPIIFAQSLMFLPSLLAGLFKGSESAQTVVNIFSNQFGWQYNLIFALMILIFTYFYTAITINPKQIADDMKRNGGFIPGVKPGDPTAEYIDGVLSRITLPGALFLAVIAILPSLVRVTMDVDSNFAAFFGGTSLLIMVGVVLDTLQQIESYLLMKHYEGLMESGKISDTSNMAMVQ